MAKHNRKGRSRTGVSFVMLRHDILKSAAYRSLKPPARAVYIEVLHRYNGSNNGEIPLSCREAAVFCNISVGTASRAFKDIQKKGFIKVGRDSGFLLKQRMAREWIITHEAIDGKIGSSNEWKTWKPDVKKSEYSFTTDTNCTTTDTATH